MEKIVNKNLHLIRTNKPSRLYINSSKKIVVTKLDYGYPPHKNVNIYITSDEKIKDGNYCIIVDNKSVLYQQFEKHKGKHLRNDQWRKIILTTDQDLIKDGIQAIDDEFLEWFVKNPSCESVKVVKESFRCCHSKDILCSCYDDSDQSLCSLFYADYEIIIPSLLVEEPKKETIEEVAERLFPFTKSFLEDRITTIKRLFWVDGAKWQAESMYSREDIENIWNEFVKEVRILYKRSEDLLDGEKVTLEQWFEQFKKG